MGKSNDIFKSFTSPVSYIVDINGEILDTEEELNKLRNDVELVTQISKYMITEELLKEFIDFTSLHPNVTIQNSIGKQMNLNPTDGILEKNGSGFSRFNRMINDRIIRELKSWNERLKAVEGSTEKYVSQGYLRTMNANRLRSLKPKMSLSSTDSQYCFIQNNPFEKGFIEMRMVINGVWRVLVLDFDNERFSGAYKISLPDVTLDEDNIPVFHFTAVYEYNYSLFSENYLISVDVGIKNYATVSVIRIEDNSVAFTTTLSQGVHSLYNKIRNANKQISALRKKKKYDEAKLHRESNSRRKRELAIIAAQEIAELSHLWGNAIIVVEDLSFISNTMSNGRWNRGELIRWVEHYSNLNGTRTLKVNPRDTSQTCPECHSRVTHPVWSVSVCSENTCSRYKIWQDRDVAATEMIAQKVISADTIKKCVSTRKKAKNATKTKVQRSPKVSKRKKYQKSRDKNAPTPKRVNRTKVRHSKGVTIEMRKLGSPRTTVAEDVLEKAKLGSDMTENCRPERRKVSRKYIADNRLYSVH